MQEKMLVEYENAKVLVTDMKIETIKEIIPILEQVTRINQPLIIIAEDVSGALSGASLTGFNVLLLKDAQSPHGWKTAVGACVRWAFPLIVDDSIERL